MRDRPIVLTIDDNQSALGTLAVLLERLHLDVLPVTGPRDAVDLARVARPQVIILNMQMAGMDCLAFMRTLRADEELADIPVIMITAAREKQKVWEAMSLGCIEVLDLPLELNRVHQALQRCNLYPERRRRYLRAPFAKKVDVEVRGETFSLNAVTLSERGIMVRMETPLARGTPVEVRLAIPGAETLSLGGEVIYVRGGTGKGLALAAGVAIKFTRVTLKDTEKLHAFVKELLIGDIVANQTETIIRPD